MVSYVVQQTVKVLDMTFVALEHLVVKVVPTIGERTKMAALRFKSIILGAKNDDGWELLQALDKRPTQRGVGGFSS